MFQISGSWESYYATLKQVPERLKQIVPFVADIVPTFRRHKVKRVLDMGCGAGRHCIHLAKNGFDIVGIDVSASALSLAKRWTEEESLKNVTLAQAAMTNIPFHDCCFDAVIGVSVIHHALKADIEETFGEIHRVLKMKGLFVANLTSRMDPRYCRGEEVETGTFRTLEAFEENRFEELHHYFTKREVLKLLACFTKAEVEPLRDRPNYWRVFAVK